MSAKAAGGSKANAAPAAEPSAASLAEAEMAARLRIGRKIAEELGSRFAGNEDAVRTINHILSAERLASLIRGQGPVSMRTAVVLEVLTGLDAMEHWLIPYQRAILPGVQAEVKGEIGVRAEQARRNAARVQQGPDS